MGSCRMGRKFCGLKRRRNLIRANVLFYKEEHTMGGRGSQDRHGSRLEEKKTQKWALRGYYVRDSSEKVALI